MTGRRRRRLLAAGFVALDVVHATQGTWLRAGGTAANVAANLAFLGWSTRLAAVIGFDDAGELVRNDLAQAGVDVTNLGRRQDVGTPLVLHQVVSRGHRFRFGCPACGRRYSRHVPLRLQEAAALMNQPPMADVFFFDRPSQFALELAARHSEEGSLVVYEPATVASRTAHRRAVSLSRLVKYSAQRSPLFRTAIPRPREDQLFVVTEGSRGAKFRLGIGEWERSDPFSVDSVDPVGAGDWMTAALIDSLVDRRWTVSHVRGAVREAQAYAALNCMVPGARLITSLIDSRRMRQHVSLLIRGGIPSLARPQDEGATVLAGLCPTCRLPARQHGPILAATRNSG
jgi:fructokinase